ncbi:MAG TPA: hypothetical protein VEX62_05740 [Candidatus Limnocylindrales bacterium]|nr:hypothetical protein [Candidatus Limnocylindrales bacterium]
MRNEAMDRLAGLVGDWELTMTNAWFLDSMETKVVGSATVDWLGDAFLVLRSVFDGEPDMVWVIGRSDANDRYVLLSNDLRGVYRLFDLTLVGTQVTFSREDPDFHQRFIATVEPDRILAITEASEDGGQSWRKDFDLIFERR